MSEAKGGEAGPKPATKGLALHRLKFIALFVFGVVLMLSMCGKKSNGEPPSSTYRAAAQELIRRELRDPSSAEFSDVWVIPGVGGGATIVCGNVNARNGYGGMTGRQRFVVGGTVALESNVGVDAMNQLWAQSC